MASRPGLCRPRSDHALGRALTLGTGAEAAPTWRRLAPGPRTRYPALHLLPALLSPQVLGLSGDALWFTRTAPAHLQCGLQPRSPPCWWQGCISGRNWA
ncbi:hypothetical protein WJX74_005126 [Apatococcus lobatus]|uniref:Uncharacterized protein n=1 Tax=Apatococcus lobatus TaxID=904363 RepID=A0AAW1RZQ6_9CHLO